MLLKKKKKESGVERGREREREREREGKELNLVKSYLLAISSFLDISPEKSLLIKMLLLKMN